MTKVNLGSKFGFFNTSNEVQMLSQSGDFAGFVFESTQLIRDQEEAQTYLKAFDTRADGWAESGVARIWGDADLWPGMCVQVLTSSKRYYTPKGDGKWFVRAVGHQADRQQYQTILFLTRPQKDPVPGYTEQPVQAVLGVTGPAQVASLDVVARQALVLHLERQPIARVDMKAIRIPFRVSGSKVDSTSDYNEVVRGQVIDALMTNQGERLFKPHYGCDIQSALFDPSDELARQDAAAIVRQRLQQFVPRCTVRSIDIDTHAPESQVDININYRASSLLGEVSLTIPLPSSEFFGRTLPGHVEQLHEMVPQAPL